MTRKLFEATDAPLAFDAIVTACEAADGQWRVALDQTAFYPEGGGQSADRGTLNGLPIVHVGTQADTLWHWLDQPFDIGASVSGCVDAAFRLDQSQHHSGEHIFSGLVRQQYGFDNVGFHIGAEVMTLDFNGELLPAQWHDLEAKANQVIWDDLPIRAWAPDLDTLRALPYRSKKALDGDIRIVEIPDVDCCACCGTHVSHTGKVGQLRLLDIMRHRGGTRISAVCGGRALADACHSHDTLHQASAALSTSTGELNQALSRLLTQRDALARSMAHWQQQSFEQWLRHDAGQSPIFFAQHLDAAQARKLCLTACEQLPWSGVFAACDSGWQFVMGAADPDMDLRPLQKRLCDALSGRGGGKPTLVQGSLATGTEAAIRELINAFPAQP